MNALLRVTGQFSEERDEGRDRSKTEEGILPLQFDGEVMPTWAILGTSNCITSDALKVKSLSDILNSINTWLGKG